MASEEPKVTSPPSNHLRSRQTLPADRAEQGAGGRAGARRTNERVDGDEAAALCDEGITAGAVQAGSVRQLLTMLAIMVGVYAVMFKAFDLGCGFDVFGLAARFGLSADAANGIAAAVFVFGLGFLVYGVKRIVARRRA